jgi:hypothetical protein
VAAGLLPRRIYDLQYAPRMFSSMIALEKTGSDQRSWHWFESF